MIRSSVVSLSLLLVLGLFCVALVLADPESGRTHDDALSQRSGSTAVLVSGPASSADEHGDEDEDDDVPVPGRETACCLPDGCQDRVDPTMCKTIGGVPFGICGTTCQEVNCPPAGCIGATGSCFSANPTPGCVPLFCCTILCNSQPQCCEGEWSQSCAGACPATADVRPCCSPQGGCGLGSSSVCTGSGGVTVSACLGDADGDGVDDACACDPLVVWAPPAP